MTITHPPLLPVSFIFAGCSQSGKTQFAKNLILNWEEIFGEEPRSVTILYAFFQPCYSEIQAKYGDRCKFATELTESVISSENLGSPDKGYAVLLIDDLGHRLFKSDLLCHLYVGACHHLKIIPASLSYLLTYLLIYLFTYLVQLRFRFF